ncbi:hypothetical protein QM012_008192 [Aureobasidium pullulans]|uniref:Uncharacterized protein n=1 Tax=Aureobasidium pullulans TaxID=5580 RepID=A0ABR0TK75_AURPU
MQPSGMNSPPTELITSIVAYCLCGRPSEGEPGLSPFALISEQRQQVDEQRIFSSLNLKSSESKVFATVYGAGPEREHRKSALKRLKYSIESIPGIDERLRDNPAPERMAIRGRNACHALENLGALYSILNSWSTNNRIMLEIRLPGQIFRPKTLSDIILITKLIKRVEMDSTNLPSTTLLEPIAFRMQGLQEIKWWLFDHDVTSNSVSRRKRRYRESPIFEHLQVHFLHTESTEYF